MARNALYPAPAPVGKIDIHGACELLGMSRATLYEYVKRDDFPKPDKINGRVWFDKASIETWKQRYEKTT